MYIPCRVAVQILTICCILYIASGCSCERPQVSRRDRHCRADFSLIGRPFYAGTSMIDGWRYRRYCFSRIYRVFKPRFWRRGTCVFTHDEPAMCGKQLQSGQIYVLNGSRQNNRYTINSCGWNERWWNVPSSARQGIFNSIQWCSPNTINTNF